MTIGTVSFLNCGLSIKLTVLPGFRKLPTGEGGYLASITSVEENSFILTNVIDGLERPPSVSDEYWLGAVFMINPNIFFWFLR